ncbi:MAG: hypothetical protein Q8L14_01550 [Myxococcales bacterium]|nr:hypothetical protein [Myxococcales bacterium]
MSRAALLLVVTGCVGAEFVRQPDPKPCVEPAATPAKSPEVEAEAREAFASFIGAVERSDFDGAFRLLDASLKRRYSPERLKSDFALEPRGVALVSRLKVALARPVQLAGDRATVVVAEGRVALAVRESDGWHVASLDGDAAGK